LLREAVIARPLLKSGEFATMQPKTKPPRIVPGRFELGGSIIG
jgi:hypothetical protein